jgi:hypothetical protein
MQLDYVPLLKIQRELHSIPRGTARFQQYLRTMLTRDGKDVELPPLGIMNPMAKEHVTSLLDALLALNADEIAARAVADVSSRLANVSGEFKLSVVVADDAMGGGTNRYAYEYDLRFGPARLRYRTQKRSWITAVLWSSEAPTEQAVREAVLTAAYRVAYVLQHGPARTIRDMLAQEGHVMAQAGCAGPVLNAEDIASTRRLLTPFLDFDDMRTAIECLFGDAAGETLGFTPRGLAPWAGLALALHQTPSASRGSVKEMVC